jgi:hypothetical protein
VLDEASAAGEPPAPAAAAPDAEAPAASGGSPTQESVPSTDETVGVSPRAEGAEAPVEAESPESEVEDVSLEAILEDLKRREGRSE